MNVREAATRIRDLFVNFSESTAIEDVIEVIRSIDGYLDREKLSEFSESVASSPLIPFDYSTCIPQHEVRIRTRLVKLPNGMYVNPNHVISVGIVESSVVLTFYGMGNLAVEDGSGYEEQLRNLPDLLTKIVDLITNPQESR